MNPKTVANPATTSHGSPNQPPYSGTNPHRTPNTHNPSPIKAPLDLTTVRAKAEGTPNRNVNTPNTGSNSNPTKTIIIPRTPYKAP